MSGVALALVVASIVLVRGGLQGYGFADSFKDIFSRIPQVGIDPPDSPPSSGGSPGGIVGGTPGAPGGVPVTGDFPPEVERWRGQVTQHFGMATPEALSVMECESGGNPTAKNALSGASGLFQHLPRYWQDRSNRAGVPGANIFDPEANIRVAAWLYRQTNTWKHWECKPKVSA